MKPNNCIKLHIVPIELKDANDLISRLHRHHKTVVGHRFSIGICDDSGTLRGAAVVGRPVARKICQRSVLEVTRLVTDGTPNACSMLYSAAARAGKNLGYNKIQTYILDSESGTTLKAAGWIFDGIFGGGVWNDRGDKPRRKDQPICKKGRWSLVLNEKKPNIKLPETKENNTDTITLFDLVL